MKEHRCASCHQDAPVSGGEFLRDGRYTVFICLGCRNSEWGGPVPSEAAPKPGLRKMRKYDSKDSR